MPSAPTDQRTRRSSSMHSQLPFHTTAPIPITQQRPPIYARPRHGSHSSHNGSHRSSGSYLHDPHTYADGEDYHDSPAGEEGRLDEDTLREYEKRYKEDRKLEKRPTLGGSLVSAFRALGGRRE